MKHAPILLALASCVVSAGHAASPPAAPESLLACSRISDPGERLRCYDAQVPAAGPAVTPPAPAVTSRPPKAAAESAAPAVTAPPPTVIPPPQAVAGGAAAAAASVPPPAPATPQAKFGADDLKQSARPKAVESEKVLVSKITSIHEPRHKLFLIVLENGQIWMQEGTQITVFFKVGDEARIEKGLFGSYRMSTVQTGVKNEVRVTRVE